MIKNFIVDKLKDAGIALLSCSYQICLLIAIISVFLYILGVKKAAKVATGSTIAYFILEAFRVML